MRVVTLGRVCDLRGGGAPRAPVKPGRVCEAWLRVSCDVFAKPVCEVWRRVFVLTGLTHS